MRVVLAEAEAEAEGQTGRWNRERQGRREDHDKGHIIAYFVLHTHKIIAVANTNWNKWLTLIAADNKLSDAAGQLLDWQIPSAHTALYHVVPDLAQLFDPS